MPKDCKFKDIEFKAFTKDELLELRIKHHEWLTKKQLMIESGLDVTYDPALPQQWLDSFSTKYNLDYDMVCSTTVYAYSEDCRFGIPCSAYIPIQECIEKEFHNES